MLYFGGRCCFGLSCIIAVVLGFLFLLCIFVVVAAEFVVDGVPIDATVLIDADVFHAISGSVVVVFDVVVTVLSPLLRLPWVSIHQTGGFSGDVYQAHTNHLCTCPFLKEIQVMHKWPARAIENIPENQVETKKDKLKKRKESKEKKKKLRKK